MTPRLPCSLIILEGHPTLTKLPSISSRLSTLSHPVYNNLSEYEERLGVLKVAHTAAESSFVPKFQFLMESPFRKSLQELSQNKSPVSQADLHSLILRTKQWKDHQKDIFDDVKMVHLTVEDYVAYRRIAYEWEWEGGEENLAQKERYQTEENMKRIWDGYYEQGNRAQLWDMTLPSDDSRQCVWILLDKLGVEYEYKKFEKMFDPENRIDKDGKFRGASFGRHDFL